MDATFLTVSQVAEKLACSQWLVRQLINKRALIAHKIAGCIRVAPADLEAYIEGCRTGPRPVASRTAARRLLGPTECQFVRR